MSSIIKVDTIQNQSGANIISESSNTITVGASGDTVSVPSGATFDASSGTTKLSANVGQLRFMASTTSATNMAAQNTWYKSTWNEQLIDNFNEFDPTTYRFTASENGTYLFNVSGSFRLNNDQDVSYLSFYKNGSISSDGDVYKIIMASASAEGYHTIAYKVALVSTDYIEVYAKYGNSSGTNRGFNSGAVGGEAMWTGWRIG
jgi:hypothetical protein